MPFIWALRAAQSVGSTSGDMRTAFHQGLYMGPEGLNADNEIIESKQYPAGVRHFSHLIEHPRDTGIAADERAHVDVHCTFGGRQLADIGVRIDVVLGALLREPGDRINVDTGACYGGPLTAVVLAPNENPRFLRAR